MSPESSLTTLLASFRKPTQPYAPERVCRCLEKPLVGLVACPSRLSCFYNQTHPSGTTSPGKTRPPTSAQKQKQESCAGHRRRCSSLAQKNFAEQFHCVSPPPFTAPSSTAFRGSYLPNCSCLLLSTCTCPLSILEAESGPSLDRPLSHASAVPGSLEKRPSRDLIIPSSRRLFSPSPPDRQPAVATTPHQPAPRQLWALPSPLHGVAAVAYLQSPFISPPHLGSTKLLLSWTSVAPSRLLLLPSRRISTRHTRRSNLGFVE